MYLVSIKPSALKDLRKIPKILAIKIGYVIDTLAENPRPIGFKKLKGSDEILFRVRVGNYRVIYSIEDKVEIVEVVRIGHRKDIYK
jgi:mRNA interferase RelE/StbE